MERAFNQKIYVATTLGNIIEHYDKVLFGLIAPFIAYLFFPMQNPIWSLILIYLPLGIIARPIGALFWGYFGDRYGRGQALYYSLLGMSLTIFLTGFLPTYAQAGLLSPILMHLKRGLVCFFAAGEGPGASLLLIENTPKEKRDLMSSYYEMSSMIGVLIASILITTLASMGKVVELWRWLFWISGLLGLTAFWFRRNLLSQLQIPEKKISVNPLPLLKNYAPALFAIICVSGFSCANYRILTKLMNGYLPLVTQLTKTEMMGSHSLLILYDFFLLLPFGFVSKKIGKEKLIAFSLFVAAIGIFPLFKLLNKPTLTNILFLRMVMITWGIALAAPFNYWASQLIPKEVRFRVLSLGRAIGAQAIGGTAISLSLFIHTKTNKLNAPAYVIFITSTVALFSMCLMYVSEKKLKKEKKLLKKESIT